MRVAIAGGSGFIGRELTRQLVAASHEVTWLSRRPGRTEPPEGVREVAFPATHGHDEWRREIAAADGVVNLSGHPIASRWSPGVKRLLVESRVETGRLLVDAIAMARSDGDGPSVFVSASGVGYYGDAGDTIVDEDSLAGTDWLARLAVEWEHTALLAEASGCRVVLVRTGLVLGSEGLVPRMALPMRLFVGGPVGDGRQWVPWIHIEDIAGAYVHALTTPTLTGPVNAAAPHPVRMVDFSRAMGRQLHRPSWLPVGERTMRVVLGEVAHYIVFSQRTSAARLRESGFTYRYPELDDALADALGVSRGQAVAAR